MHGRMVRMEYVRQLKEREGAERLQGSLEGREQKVLRALEEAEEVAARVAFNTSTVH